MKLKFIPPPQASPIYIANVHRTGKIGFTIATATHFEITTSKSMALAINEDDLLDDSIYGVLLMGQNHKEGYKIMKSGEYHSVNAKGFFDEAKMDYSKPISYIVTDFQVNGTSMLKFTKKEPKTA